MSGSSKARILVVDDEKPITDVLSASLQDENYLVQICNSGDEALPMMEKFRPDVVLLDIWMPGSKDGIDVLREAKPKLPNTEFLIMSGHGTIETAVKATKLGAWDFIEKPLSMDRISILIHNILLFQETINQKNALLNKLRKNIAIIGESPAMVQLKQMISKAAPSTSSVLLRGENGTGKELVAQNLHYLSSRAGKTFVDVNCGSIPEDLVASELFGHERGAFTGSHETRRGKFELADGGTIFLNEIADLSIHVQAKILRVIEEKKLERVSGKEALDVDVRVIASSTKNLEKEVKEGRFREDLYQRLSLVSVSLPGLRERMEDIPALILHFSEMFSKQGGYRLKTFSAQAMTRLQTYQWVGNVRELRNFVERIFIITTGDFVDLEQLKMAGLSDVGPTEDEFGGESSLKEARARFERDFILKKLEENSGNISKTAEVIGVERSHLHRKIKSYGIDA